MKKQTDNETWNEERERERERREGEGEKETESREKERKEYFHPTTIASRPYLADCLLGKPYSTYIAHFLVEYSRSCLLMCERERDRE